MLFAVTLTVVLAAWDTPVRPELNSVMTSARASENLTPRLK
jgi:hypothetical protein